MKLSFFWRVFLLPAVAFWLIAGVSAEKVSLKNFPVYQLAHYENGEDSYGSMRDSSSAPVYVHQRGTSVEDLVRSARSTSTGKRAFLFLSAEDLLDEEVVDALIVKPLNFFGVLVMLPEDDSVLRANRKALKALEKKLMQSKLMTAFYFTKETSELAELKKELSGEGKQGIERYLNSRTSFTVSSKSQKRITEISAENLKSTIPFLYIDTKEEKLRNMPAIVILANMDIFTSVPALSNDLSSTGSSIIAFMELSRMFATLEVNAYKMNHRLVFVLTSGGFADFKGTEQWLIKEDPMLLERVEFALCLDGLTSGDLTLHLPAFLGEEAELPKFLEVLKKGMEFYGGKLKLQYGSDASSGHGWQHEKLLGRNILSGTLTHKDSPDFMGSVFDYTLTDNERTSLHKNIRILAESLAHYTFNVESFDVEVFEGRLAMNEALTTSLEAALVDISRFPADVSADPAKSFSKQAKELLRTFMPCNSQQFVYVLDNYAFFKQEKNVITITKSKMPILDTFHILFNVVFLLGIGVIAGGVEKTKKLVTGDSSTVKKGKTA